MRRMVFMASALVLAGCAVKGEKEAAEGSDVTAKVAAEVKGGQLDFVVSDAGLGRTDHAGWKMRKLRIEYRAGERVQARCWLEGQRARIAAPAGQKLEIVRATYGQLKDPVDITDFARGKMAGHTVTIPADSGFIGIDPEPGEPKQLVAHYSVGKNFYILSFMEGQTFRIHQPVPDAPAEIQKVTWGLPVTWFDVTDLVAAQVKGDVLDTLADNNYFSDPTPGFPKELEIQYTVGGKAHVLRVNEGDPVKIPAPGDGGGKLAITKATYGLLAK